MLLRIGTQKYHLYIAFLKWYDGRAKQLNLFELGFTPWFCFVIRLTPLELYIDLPYATRILLWIRQGEIIVNNKFISRRKNA